MAKTTDALNILQQITSEDPEMEEMIKESFFKAELAQMIYRARVQAGLSQQQLADCIGTKQSAIAQLEDGEYEEYSLLMLQKIARALDLRLEIHLIPIVIEKNGTEQISA